MKLSTTILLCTASAIGTAYALDKMTDGLIRETVSDMMIEHGISMKDSEDFDDFDDDSLNVFSACEIDDTSKKIRPLASLETPDDPSMILMDIDEADNIYQMLEDAILHLSETESDVDSIFGDKTNSFKHLYDALEEADTIRNSKSAEETNEPISDDPSVCGHSE